MIKKKKFLGKYKYLSPKDLSKFPSDRTLIIITAGLLDLYSEIVKNKLFYFNIIHKKSIEFYHYFKSKNKIINQNLSYLDDKKSKFIYLQKLNNIISGNFVDTNIYSSCQYLNNDLIQNGKKIKKIIYAGAFDGYNMDRFLKLNKKIIINAFEPSSKMYRFLKNKYKKNNDIKIFNSLLWSQNDLDIRFNDDSKNEGLSASVINSASLGSTYKVKTFKIDNLIDKFRADMIALDVEGSELKALDGAKKYINKHKPILGICIYHNAYDYAQIIKTLYLNYKQYYKFYIRQHSVISYIETVLYCIPKK